MGNAQGEKQETDGSFGTWKQLHLNSVGSIGRAWRVRWQVSRLVRGTDRTVSGAVAARLPCSKTSESCVGIPWPTEILTQAIVRLWFSWYNEEFDKKWITVVKNGNFEN